MDDTAYWRRIRNTAKEVRDTHGLMNVSVICGACFVIILLLAASVYYGVNRYVRIALVCSIPAFIFALTTRSEGVAREKTWFALLCMSMEEGVAYARALKSSTYSKECLSDARLRYVLCTDNSVRHTILAATP